MSNKSESKLARRADDKRADRAVDWTDAPRFTAFGIAETWSVTVEAEGQRVVSISDEHVAGLDGERLDQFVPTIRSCAQHLLGFIGAAPTSSTAGAAKGGITSLEGLTRYDYVPGEAGRMVIGQDDSGPYVLLADVERLLATAAGEQAEPKREKSDNGPALANAIASIDRGEDDEGPETPGIYSREEVVDLLKYEIVTDSGARTLLNGDSMEFSLGELALLANRAAYLARQAAPASPEQVQATGKRHELKTDPAVFAAVLTGAKTHEIRKNDRDFAVGDILLLRETASTGAEIAAGAPLVYTGREIVRTVSHVLTGYGLQDGWCILSLAAPIAAAPAAEEVRNQALEEVVRLIDKKVEDYDREHGSYDHTTGVTEYPGDGAEWVQEMDELADEIRAMKRAASIEGEARDE